MLELTKFKKKQALFLLLAVMSGALLYIFVQLTHIGTAYSSLYYAMLIMIWSLTIDQRILSRRIRLDLRIAAIFVISLFIMRGCKYSIFDTDIDMQRLLWYFFYVPFINVPLLSLTAAYRIGKPEDARTPLFINILRVLAVLLVIGVLTNDLHGAVFSFSTGGDPLRETRHWLFFVVIAWITAVFIASYAMLIHRCRSSLCRRYAFVPVAVTGAGILLWVIYIINSGSPRFLGLNLYNIQEIYAFIFIGLWESSIMIGLVSSNTGYRELFRQSHLNAVIKDASGKEFFRSAETDIGESAVRSSSLSCGVIEWKEDISAISSVNATLAEAARQLEEENGLLEEENRITAERVRLETQNNTYDSITAHVERQLREINSSLSDDEMPELRTKFCLILGTYIKRVSNLILISAGSSEISSDELLFSVRESIEYLSLLGIDCFADSGTKELWQADCIVLAYDIFEAVVEQSMYRIHALAAAVVPGNGVLLRIETDSADRLGTEQFSGELSRLGMELDVREYDGQSAFTVRWAAL